jgi:hypothetical protein
MSGIDKFKRAVLVLASLVVPVGMGILIGVYYMLRPERKNDYLGPMCIILGVVNFLIVRYITSL